MTEKPTLVLGASEKPWRYSYMAVELLNLKQVPVSAVGLKAGKIGSIPIFDGQPKIENLHTITMYVAPENQGALESYIFSLQPRRIIFNPGTENVILSKKAAAAGIEVVEACTLVMLRTGQF